LEKNGKMKGEMGTDGRRKGQRKRREGKGAKEGNRKGQINGHREQGWVSDGENGRKLRDEGENTEEEKGTGGYRGVRERRGEGKSERVADDGNKTELVR